MKMKEIELYQLQGDPRTVLSSLDFDACLDGYDPEVDPSVEMFYNIYFVSDERAVVPFEIPIIMHGPLRYIQGRDILSVEPHGWIVISSKFKTLLAEMEPVEQQFIPVRIYDGEVRSGDDLSKTPQRFTDDYFLLYLPTTLKIFNYRESEYSFDYVNPDGSLEFAEDKAVAPYAVPQLEAEHASVDPTVMVLNAKEGDLPLYFRLNVTPLTVYVSRKGAERLAKAKLKNLYLPRAYCPVYTTD